MGTWGTVRYFEALAYINCLPLQEATAMFEQKDQYTFIHVA